MPPYVLRHYKVTFSHQNYPDGIHFSVMVNAADVHDATTKALHHREKLIKRPNEWVLAEVKVSG